MGLRLKIEFIFKLNLFSNIEFIFKYDLQFRHRTFHEPNLIRIKTDPNYLDRLN